MKITYACPFLRVSQKSEKKFKSLYGFGGRCLNITDVCMDFEPCFKVYNFVSVYLKGIKPGQNDDQVLINCFAVLSSVIKHPYISRCL